MSSLRKLFRLPRRRASPKPSQLDRLAARLPPEGAAGLLPASDDDEAERERSLGERWAIETHRHSRAGAAPFTRSRRLAAIASSARRRAPDELAEALQGLLPWELPALLDELGTRSDLSPAGLVKTARALAKRASDLPTLAGAIGVLRPGVGAEDLPLLFLASRSPALSGICALCLEGLPAEQIDPSLLEAARGSLGLARALLLERLGARQLEGAGDPEPWIAEALTLAAAIDDPLERVWAAIPLLEAAPIQSLLEKDPEVALPVAHCLEAVARGGWNGGPGPGLGRLPGAIQAALALLAAAGISDEARSLAAQAVVDARPIPGGPVRREAEKTLAATR